LLAAHLSSFFPFPNPWTTIGAQKELQVSSCVIVVQIIMQRNPKDRPTGEELRKILEEHDNSGTVGSFTSTWPENVGATPVL
jgi:hypothetical protein